MAYHVGLAKVRYLRDLFPDFYQEHFAARPLTPRALLAAVEAFLSLVHRDLFELEDCMVLNIWNDPRRALDYTEVASQDPLLMLEEASYWLRQPRPLLYGIGIEAILEDETPPCALTLALWQLASLTSWSIGVDVADIIGFSNLPDRVATYIKRLPPLPFQTPMEQIVDQVDLPHRPYSTCIGELICYAFARTENPMANVTNYEVDVVYGGEIDSEWSEARSIAATAAAAAELVGVYGQWAMAVERDPERELSALAEALRAATLPHIPKSNALVDILAPLADPIPDRSIDLPQGEADEEELDEVTL